MQSIESYAKRLAAEAAASREGPRARGWDFLAVGCLIRVSVIYLILKHPKTPVLARIVASITIAYALSPVQLIPNFIPAVGCLDDAVILSVGSRLLAGLTPAVILAQCRQNAVSARTKWLRDVEETRGLRTWRFLQ